MLPINVNDKALFRKLYLDPSISKMLFVRMTVKDVDAWFVKVHQNKAGAYHFYKISHGPTEKIVGIIGLIHRLENVEEYGILLDEESRYKGIATIVTQMLVDKVRRSGRNSQIIGRCIAQNAPMINVFKKCGFEQICCNTYEEIKIDFPHIMFRKNVT
ncbi:GNAT family N-acetyltransferase [Alteromonas sp. ASW11-130]|uniref:GNAT family N-acetyltransferase n=1 Tax=Alteromonas sp. ASW11-130 TaxID=3015775 RepID=UPI002241D631|nr:GNAT family N-acetyltransferase [Alteromonas sp. ASW11-130]MCW8091462.1 GNAT family N-acetyltransferase [Alteromonas sp. ASW11-130]